MKLKPSPDPIAASTAPDLKERLGFVDGLRGVAALAVALFHIYLTSPARAHMPLAGERLLLQGDLGVAVFFVLSGFVIAHSLEGVEVTLAVFGRFMARRLIRLHPPYVASILLSLAVVPMSNLVLRDRVLPYPAFDTLAAHFFYLEDLLGVPKINDVYWTLCLEVQFYLLFVLLVGLAQRVWGHRAAPGAISDAGRSMVFGPVAVYCMAVAAGFGGWPLRGVCFPQWPMFFGGAVACWLVRKRIHWGCGLVYGLILGGLAFGQGGRMMFAALITMGLLLAGCRWKSIVAWLTTRPVQYLGMISYSLYLVHPLFGQRLANLLGRIAGSSKLADWGVFVGAIAGALAGAHLFWRFVEVPAIAWSKSIKLRPQGKFATCPTSG